MKKYFALLILLVAWCMQLSKAQTVYITDTGAKYHSGTCRFLKKCKLAIELSEAKETYEACKVCHPSQTITVTKTTEAIESHQSS